MEDVMTFYGFPVLHGKALCPFHKDTHPSLKVYRDSFYCFSCGAGGDLINFVARLNNVNNYTAAQKLNQDFGLGLDLDAPKPQINFQIILKKKQQAWIDHAEKILTDYRRDLWQNKDSESYQQLEKTDYLLDWLYADPEDFYKQNQSVVMETEQRLHTRIKQKDHIE